ncbi:hypothetical protein BGX33_008974 [Mortierella sp. NVP41]|nr:hypothetical protein BGX33_008974 [Mortierella sp. NVP41]
MDSASDQFFRIPELVALVASTMETRDLLRFLRTSRFIHTQCIPHLYRDVDVRADFKCRLLCSQEGLKALARNTHNARGIQMDGHFFDHYYKCLTTVTTTEQVQDRDDASAGIGTEGGAEAGSGTTLGKETGTGAAMAIGTPPPPTASSPSSASSPSTPTLTEITIPLVTHLSLFDYNYPAPGLNPFDKYPPELKSGGNVLAKFCHMARLTPHLTDVRLSDVEIKHQGHLNHLATTLSRLTDLWTLRLKIDCSNEEVINRQERTLCRLKEWDVRGSTMAVETVLSMLECCPGLESMRIPLLESSRDEGLVARLIVQYCPKLRRLLHHRYMDDDDTDDWLFWRITNAMPENSLESFSCEDFGEDNEDRERSLKSLLSRHFRSLKEVHLEKCIGVCRTTIGMLLRNVPNLEVLVIDGDTVYTIAVGLKNLGGFWASTRLREFRVMVHMGYPFHWPGVPDHQPVNYQVLAPMPGFKKFMKRLGEQTDLRVSGLKVRDSCHGYHEKERRWTFRDEVFPGLLSLNDKTACGRVDGSYKPGEFLKMLGRLSKLEELRGSVSLNPWERHGYTTGKNEACWIVMHWPKLRVAEFYPKHRGNTTPPVDPSFLWLQTQLRGLVYSDGSEAND